jgi:hypothetical protein
MEFAPAADHLTRGHRHDTVENRPDSRSMRATPAIAAIGLAAVGIVMTVAMAAAEPPEITLRRALERKTFTDAEITEGFFRTAFGAELHLSGAADRIRKFDGPVRVYLDSRVRPDRRAEVAAVLADIRTRVAHLDIALVEDRAGANVALTLVHDRDLAHTIGQIHGEARARKIEDSLAPQCLSSFRRDEAFRIAQANVIIVADAGDFTFFDCIYEELLQALGPINDTDTVPWTMFNDDVRLGYFDVFDQYILNILYDPRIRPGMTADDVRAVLPQVLPSVRDFVARINNLPP